MCDIFETLPQSGDDFETAKEKLTEYFDHKKNVEYEIYNFRQAKQNHSELMNAYHSVYVNWYLHVSLLKSTRKLNSK